MGESYAPMLRSTNIYSGAQFSRGTHAFIGFSCLGGQYPLGGLSQLGGNLIPRGIAYPESSHVFRRPFFVVSPHMGGPSGPYGMNRLLSLDQNPFFNMKFPFLEML